MISSKPLPFQVVSILFYEFDKLPFLLYFQSMQSVVLHIYDDSKVDSLLSLLRDLRYVEVRGTVPAQTGDIYAGLPSKLDDDLLQSQIDVLEKVDW
jgi:hypothetical protein